MVILSVISKLEHRTPYGAVPSEVYDAVSAVIELMRLEYE
jgi:hypothetical protein